MSRINTKGSYLSINEREFIEAALNRGLSLAKMAEHIHKDKTIISKEIKRTRIFLTHNPERVPKAGRDNNWGAQRQLCNESCSAYKVSVDMFPKMSKPLICFPRPRKRIKTVDMFPRT